LTQNEYAQAKRYKDDYVLLIFTAETEETLKQAVPEVLHDPVGTRKWDERIAREYLLVDES